MYYTIKDVKEYFEGGLEPYDYYGCGDWLDKEETFRWNNNRLYVTPHTKSDERTWAEVCAYRRGLEQLTHEILGSILKSHEVITANPEKYDISKFEHDVDNMMYFIDESNEVWDAVFEINEECSYDFQYKEYDYALNNLWYRFNEHIRYWLSDEEYKKIEDLWYQI